MVSKLNSWQPNMFCKVDWQGSLKQFSKYDLNLFLMFSKLSRSKLQNSVFHIQIRILVITYKKPLSNVRTNFESYQRKFFAWNFIKNKSFSYWFQEFRQTSSFLLRRTANYRTAMFKGTFHWFYVYSITCFSTYFEINLEHSHKKWSDRLETRAVLKQISILSWNLARFPKHQGSR